MKFKSAVFCAAVLILGLSACAPNPVDIADGIRIQEEAAQDALNQEQLREQRAIEHAQKMKNEQAAALEWQGALRGWILVGKIFGGTALVFLLLGAGVGGSIAIVGAGQGISAAAKLKANLIYMDPATGTFPQFVFHVHGSKYALADPNTHSSILLDMNNPADKQSIINAGYIAALGVQSRHARTSLHEGDVASVPTPEIPLVIEGKST